MAPRQVTGEQRPDAGPSPARPLGGADLAGLRASPAWFALAAATLALLLAHASVYRFQCDDAFISFRYARNLSHGYGLVFNPGLERVEGYSNLLWVLLLAALDRVGLRPERSADVLSIALTIGLWACVVWFAVRRAGRSGGVLALAPALLLGLTRSVAVFSTSGLETRLFELLFVGAVLRLVVELEGLAPIAEAVHRPIRPVAGWLFGLAALTRPEGFCLGACVLFTAACLSRTRDGHGRHWFVATLAPLLALTLAQLAFRRIYYGEWLPNTFYAKVGTHARWSLGLRYVAQFVIEYGLVLWLPLVIAGALQFRRQGRGHVPLLFAAAAVPLTIYIAAIGGDHFEYRPLDPIFPLAFLVMGEGVRAWAGAPRTRLVAAAALLAAVFGIVNLPLRAHLEFPNRYITGFPGRALSFSTAAREYLSPDRDVVFRLPPLRPIGRWYQAHAQFLSNHFVGIRAEEHRLFLATVLPQGHEVRDLVEQGVLPPDARVALDCVGAVPYYSDLPVLDRHGLTDAIISRRPATFPGVIGHEKGALPVDAQRFGVELWAVSPTHLVLPLTSERLLFAIKHAELDSLPIYVANLPTGGTLVCTLPLGREHVAAHMPRLALEPASDPAVQRDYAMRAEPAFRERLQHSPDDPDAIAGLAYLSLAKGRVEEALQLYSELVRLLPGDADVWEEFATCHARLGRSVAERVALEHTIVIAREHGDRNRATRVSAKLQALADPD